MSEKNKISHGFLFVVSDSVKISCSGEDGEIIGRAQYKHSQNQYLIRYKSIGGGAVEQWWGEDAIELNQQTKKEVD